MTSRYMASAPSGLPFFSSDWPRIMAASAASGLSGNRFSSRSNLAPNRRHRPSPRPLQPGQSGDALGHVLFRIAIPRQFAEQSFGQLPLTLAVGRLRQVLERRQVELLIVVPLLHLREHALQLPTSAPVGHRSRPAALDTSRHPVRSARRQIEMQRLDRLFVSFQSQQRRGAGHLHAAHQFARLLHVGQRFQLLECLVDAAWCPAMPAPDSSVWQRWSAGCRAG